MPATRTLDARGLKCPLPVLKVATLAAEMSKGETLEILGNCDTFQDDMRKWAERSHVTVLAVNKVDDHMVVLLQF